MFDHRLEQLSSVSLEELTETADLQSRIDRKYLVSVRLATDLLDHLDSRNFRALTISKQRLFEYSSLYFDTPERESFLSSAHGRRRRFKIRTRTYEADAAVFLEVKTAGPRGSTVKHRLAHHGPRDTIDTASAAWISTVLQQPSLAERCRPTMGTRYRRATFLDQGSSTRITIDRDLTAIPFGGEPRPLGDGLVIETKSLGAPTETDRWLWRAGSRPVALSKFGVAMVLCNPGLPSARWNRVLRQWFDWQP